VQINSSLIFLVEHAKARWKNLQDSYKKSKARQKQQTVSDDIVTNCLSHSNITIPTISTPIPTSRPISPAMATPNSVDRADAFNATTPVGRVKNSTKIKNEALAASTLSMPTATAVSRKKKKADVDPFEQFLLKEIAKDGSKEKKEENDADELFCASLVPTLKRLIPKKNQLCKIKIQQLLFDVEFGDP